MVFGVGGLALMRLEYDCLGLVLARQRAEEPPPQPGAPDVDPIADQGLEPGPAQQPTQG